MTTTNHLGSDRYGQLAEPFATTFRDVRGGVELEYITGEQCISRLNEAMGVSGWSFTIREHGIHAEADECWVLGQLVANIDGQRTVKQQFGSQKVKRSRSTGAPLDIGFDLKGAATDSLKKCAMLLGVGLYLSRKEPPAANGGTANAAGASNGHSPAVDDAAALLCVDCGTALKETRFRDGTIWQAAQLAGFGQRKHGRVLCMEHYRAANEAKQRVAQQGEATHP